MNQQLILVALFVLISSVMVTGCNKPVTFSDQLAAFPDVELVDVPRTAVNPKQRIVHIKNCLWVDHPAFAIELRKRELSLTDDEIDRRYKSYLQEVKAIQAEQTELLLLLARKYGVRRVFYEGLTQEELPVWMDKIKDLRLMSVDLHEKEIIELNKWVAKSKPGSNHESSLKEVRARREDELKSYWCDILRIGSPGQLLMSGDLSEVLPIDDATLLDEATPTVDDEPQFIHEGGEAREDAILRALMKGGPLVVVVLGGAHDLTNNLMAAAATDVEYLTVTTRSYREASQ